MPRTFSRGDKITAAKVFEFIQYIPVDQTEDFVREIRVLFCPEPPLDEQEIIEPLLDILQSLTGLRAHIEDVHTDFGLHLVRRWITPARDVTSDLLALTEERYKRQTIV